MTVFALLGALAGCGLAAVVAGLRTRRRSLSELVASLEVQTDAFLVAGAPDAAAEAPGRGPLLARLGRGLDAAAGRLGRPLVREEDLAILARDGGTQLASIGLAAVALGAGGAVAVGALLALGLHLPAVAILGAALLGAAGGTALAVSDLRRTAESEREAFVRGLACYFELVALAQAGGMGLEGALHTSAAISNDPCFRRLRAALAKAEIAAHTPWESIGKLGREIGVRQLEELAGTLSLAGSEGARVRATLVAKAASLRQHELARAEAEANATNERLFLPSIVLMLAFMVFLMYPAGVRLTHIL